VLIVDDEEIAREGLEMALEEEYLVEGAASAEEGLEHLRTTDFQILITDLRMPGMTGMELLRRAHELNPELIVFMITGFASIGTAVEAMRDGATDYIPKPYNLEDVRLRLRRALKQRDLEAKNRGLQREAHTQRSRGCMVGESPPMKKLFRLLDKVAGSQATVLVSGASGTGKELVARELHRRSNRSDAPFLSINCGAIPLELVESELFGHEKGAFSGAHARRAGLFEAAAGGTVFLDEIGELAPSVQVALLRVLQQREVVRIGSPRPIAVDFRLISATNRNLHEEVAQKAFREDLYYRIRVVEITLPDLKDRSSDIPLLAAHFLDLVAQREGSKPKSLSPRTLELLARYSWPGNVRELENIIDRAVILSSGNRITPTALPPEISEAGLQADGIPTLEEVERDHIERVLNRVGGNRTQAAKILGVDRSSLWRKLKDRPGEA
jgi:DNA-binding NtrC family response regulator